MMKLQFCRAAALFLLILASNCMAGGLTLSLSGRTLENPLPGYYLQDLFLSQAEDSCLGYYNPVGPAQYSPLFFQRSIRDELKEFLLRSMPQEPGLKPLVVRVNRIYLYEITRGVRQQTCADLCLSMILMTDSGLVCDFTTSVTSMMWQQEFAATIGKVISDALAQSFAQYAERKESGHVEPALILPEQLHENPLYSDSVFRCFKERKPSRGIYKTYVDFRDDLPDPSEDYTFYFRQDEKKTEFVRATLKYKGGHAPRGIWGFSTGDSLFIRNGNSFSLLYMEEGHFVSWSRVADFSEEVLPAIIFGGIVGGMIGATVAGGLAASGSGMNRLEKFKLDVFDGKLYPVEMQDYTRISSDVVLFYSKSSDPCCTMGIYSEGQHLCEMQPGTYFTIRKSCHFSALKILFRSSNGNELEMTLPLELYNTDLYILKTHRNGAISAKYQTDEMKNNLLKQQTALNTICPD